MWQDIESVLHHPHESERLLTQHGHHHHPDNGGHLSDFSEYHREQPETPSSTTTHQPNYYPNYAVQVTSAAAAAGTPSSSSTSYELDLSVHSNTVKCEPDTTHKDTKMDDISSSTTNESRSPYMDLYAATNSHYGDNNNDLPKLEPINYYENNHRYLKFR